MQARDRERTAGLDFTRDARVIERAVRLERDQRRLRIALVPILDRRLHRSQSGSVHASLPF
jgi:hypothetical protein